MGTLRRGAEASCEKERVLCADKGLRGASALGPGVRLRSDSGRGSDDIRAEVDRLRAGWRGMCAPSHAHRPKLGRQVSGRKDSRALRCGWMLKRSRKRLGETPTRRLLRSRCSQACVHQCRSGPSLSKSTVGCWFDLRVTLRLTSFQVPKLHPWIVHRAASTEPTTRECTGERVEAPRRNGRGTMAKAT